MGNDIHIKYLIANEQDKLWGLTVNTVGRQLVGVNAEYPPRNHPTRYLFSTQKGRILDEYQLLYIVEGGGWFISKSQKKTQIKAGNMFLLFPGEWHNYEPNKSIGWTEYWIGFKGENLDVFVNNNFFSKQKPIFNIGYSEEIIQLYKQAVRTAQSQQTGFQQILAGIVNYLLGIAYSQDKFASFEEQRVTKYIQKAKVYMLENFHTRITPEDVAVNIGMSYSSFRHIFKKYTGFSPHQYILELRIRKSQELLTNTILTSQEIAFEIGFDNPDYFCTAFKKRIGKSPILYREFTKGDYVNTDD